ncbi:MAG: recombinase family protein [Acholeplasmatales bacterium]|nr:recombinase family protein [Acholeplasmatales bacterium]
MKEKILACCYTRFSTDHQNQSSTIGQLRAIKAYCDKNNIELIDTYIDEAQSGTNMNRTNFQKLLADAPTALWDTVVVYNMSRLSRSVKDTLIIKEKFKKMGKKILSVIENQEETPEGDFFNLITYGLNELFVKQFKRDSWRGMLVNAHDCKVQGGIPPLGFKVGKDRKYEVDEAEAKIVRIVFDKVTNGSSYRDIANYLNENGYTNRGKPFKINFTEMLRNEKYKGIYVWNLRESKDKLGYKTNRLHKADSEVIRIVGGIPRIVDDEVFDKVQKILEERRKSNKQRGPKSKYLLSGLIQCGSCGRSFSGGYSFSGLNKYYRSYYKCTSNKSPSIKCSSKDINKDHLDLYIKKLITNVVINPDNANIYKDYINTYIAKKTSIIKERLASLEKKSDELKEEASLLATSLIDSSEDEYIEITKMIGKNTAERTRLDIERNKLLEAIVDEKTTKQKVLEQLRSIRTMYYPNGSKDIIHKLISKIVMNDDTIDTYIDLTYMFVIYDYLEEKRVLLCIKEPRINIADKMKLLEIDYSSNKLEKAVRNSISTCTI